MTTVFRIHTICQILGGACSTQGEMGFWSSCTSQNPKDRDRVEEIGLGRRKMS